jgi:DNA-binding NtrC family response regulator
MRVGAAQGAKGEEMQARARVLFVNDNERIVDLLHRIFGSDYTVHAATSAKAALDIIAAHRIDVIVCDQRMPGMLGTELLAEVRKRSPSTMRVLMTGYSDLAAIVGSVNDGEIFRFLDKPCDQGEIRRAIADAAKAARTAALVPAGVAKAPASISGREEQPAVLLIDGNARDRAALSNAIGDQFAVHGAGDIAQALRILKERRVGVIVSEARVGGRDAGELLRMLKQHYPEITTVMLTNAADSDLIIPLINSAQIFRFATKPIRADAFRLAVSAAMREHRRIRVHPKLLGRHRVVDVPAPADDSMMRGVITGLSRWRGRLARFATPGRS